MSGYPQGGYPGQAGFPGTGGGYPGQQGGYPGNAPPAGGGYPGAPGAAPPPSGYHAPGGYGGTAPPPYGGQPQVDPQTAQWFNAVDQGLCLCLLYSAA